MSEQNKVKKPKSKPKSAPKLWRDVAQHIADAGGKLVPSKTHPYCLKCKLHELGCKGPVAPTGSTEPKLTVLFEGVTPKEETNGLACGGSRNGAVRKHIERLAKAQNLDPSSIRYLPVTRCAVHQKVKVNYNTKANWCRTFAVDDLRNHPPSLILAIGSTALGALSHKSSAQDWSGVPLNWRGWPDDWLMGKNFKEWGHPSQIPRPQAGDWRQLRAVQAPYIVYAQQSQEVLQNWLRQLNTAVARCQVTPETKNYVLPHYRLIEDPDELIRELDAIPSGTDIDYDVETTGLHAFNKTARLTTAMIRYITADGQAKVLIFPVEHGPMIEHLPRVLPRLARVLHECKLSGHNIAFDVVYTSARLRPYVDLWLLASAVADDTRLMAYALRQSRQSLGLERLAYAWTKSMGGYEEEFVMMMESDEHRATLHPNEGGHYANALDMPEAKPAYIAYTGGDVEVVGQAKVELRGALTKTVGYGIPLADPDNLGRFKLYQTPSRKFAYDYIVKRGIRTLSRMMARGMHVDKTELEHQEDVFPKLITEARAKLREIDPRIIAWCAQQEATVPDWKLDLENRDQLKTILFEILQLPVKRLTESGERVLGEEADLTKLPREMVLQYAAIDKFTINNLVAESPNLAPLKDYRKLYKAYTAFVRSMRNIKTEGIDKSERSKHQYLMEDMCVHPSFNQAGTDSGRISASSPNAQQIPRESIIKRMYDSRFGRKEGCIFQADLSQIELRLLAAACGDPLMVDAYRRGIDLHSLTTSRVFKIPYEHFEKKYMAGLQEIGKDKEAKELDRKRKIGKTTNFLTGYGGGPFGLQTSLAEGGVYLDMAECEYIVEALFDTYPCLRKHIAYYKRFIMDNGCAVSLFGRVRWFDEVRSDDQQAVSKALRAGFNHLIQASASDLMILACSAVDGLMKRAGLESILTSTVHDSMVIDARRSELPQVYSIVDEVTNNLPDVVSSMVDLDQFDNRWLYTVPLEADAEVGKNYMDQDKIIPDKITGKVDWDKLFYKWDAAKN